MANTIFFACGLNISIHRDSISCLLLFICSYDLVEYTCFFSNIQSNTSNFFNRPRRAAAAWGGYSVLTFCS